MQRLITQQVVDQKGARYITDTLWVLMESGTEEVKILQSVTLLLTTNTIVHGETLARVYIFLVQLSITDQCYNVCFIVDFSALFSSALYQKFYGN